MDATSTDAILDAAVCPHSLFHDNYPVFLESRSRALADYAADKMAY